MCWTLWHVFVCFCKLSKFWEYPNFRGGFVKFLAKNFSRTFLDEATLWVLLESQGWSCHISSMNHSLFTSVEWHVQKEESNNNGDDEMHVVCQKVAKGFLGQNGLYFYLSIQQTSNKSCRRHHSFEAWIGTKPSIKHLRICGSICHSLVPSIKISKLDGYQRCFCWICYKCYGI